MSGNIFGIASRRSGRCQCSFEMIAYEFGLVLLADSSNTEFRLIEFGFLVVKFKEDALPGPCHRPASSHSRVDPYDIVDFGFRWWSLSLEFPGNESSSFRCIRF